MEKKVIVDKRERNSTILQKLQAKGILLDMQMLHVGDYIISDRVAIERKTISDFENSIINGRLFDQITRLKEVYDSPVLILEGDKEQFRLKDGVLNGTICATCIDYGVYIIRSDSAEETAEIIARIADHEQSTLKRMPSAKGAARARSDSDFQERVIANLPYIGPKISKQLLAHFGSIKKIANASTDQLMKVDNIGKKRAERINHLINSEYCTLK